MKNIFIKKYEEIKFMPNIIYNKSNTKTKTQIKKIKNNLNYSSIKKNSKYSINKAKNTSINNYNLKNLQIDAKNINLMNKKFKKNSFSKKSKNSKLLKSKIKNFYKKKKISIIKNNSIKPNKNNFISKIHSKSKIKKNKINFNKNRISKSINIIKSDIIDNCYNSYFVNKLEKLKNSNKNDYLTDIINNSKNNSESKIFEKIKKIKDVILKVKNNKNVKNKGIQTKINIDNPKDISCNHIHSIINDYSKKLLLNMNYKQLNLLNNFDLYKINKNEKINKFWWLILSKLYCKNNVIEEILKILNEGDVKLDKLFEFVYKKNNIQVNDDSSKSFSIKDSLTYLSSLSVIDKSFSNKTNQDDSINKFKWCFNNLEKYETTSEEDDGLT